MPTVTATDDRKVIPAIPPLNWKKEIPKYRISRETKPAPKERFRFEPPFSSGSESDVWQYGERVNNAGEIIETTDVASWTKDAKTELQEWLQARRLPVPTYRIVATRGNHLVEAKLRFQACDKNACLPPKTITVPIDVIGK